MFKTIDALKNDGRYSINLEYCGADFARFGLKPGQAYVIRFCGDFIDKSASVSRANILMERYERSRWT